MADENLEYVLTKYFMRRIDEAVKRIRLNRNNSLGIKDKEYDQYNENLYKIIVSKSKETVNKYINNMQNFTQDAINEITNEVKQLNDATTKANKNIIEES